MGQQTPPRRGGKRPRRTKGVQVDVPVPPEVEAYVQQVMAKYGICRECVVSHLLERGLRRMASLPPAELGRRLAGARPGNGEKESV